MTNENELNCMSFAAGKGATASGYVLIGHNEDDNGVFSVRHAYVPAADWPEGSFLPAEAGCAKIPQLTHTFGYYWTEYKKPAGGISNGDMFINENGVCIVSNSMAGSREKDEDNDVLCTEGGIYYNLRRCLAERSASAREGARILIKLIETYGYASSGRAYTIADRDEVFHFQLVRGKHYMGARLPDDAVMVMPNHYDFKTLHDCPEMFYPDDIIEYAVSRGWYKPQIPGDYSDFDFSLAYQSPGMRRDSFNTSRQRQGQHMLLGLSPYSTDFSFCHKAAKLLSPSDFAAALSSHSESFFKGCIGYGPGFAPHDVQDNSPICRTTTLESSIIEFTDGPEKVLLHSAFGRPCELPYVSFLPLEKLPEQLGAMKNPAAAMASHFEPDETAGTVESGPLAGLRKNQTLAELSYCRSSILLGSLVRENHRELNVIRENIEQLKADNGKFFDEAFKAVSETLKETLIRIYPAVQAFDPGDRLLPDRLCIRFEADGDPDPYSLVAGPEGRSVRKFYSKLASPELFRKLEGRLWEAVFSTKQLEDSFTSHGTYRLYIAGRTEAGMPFAGETEITL